MAGHRIKKRGVKVPRTPKPGGRRPDSFPLIGEPGWDVLPTDMVVAWPIDQRAIPMPNGGVRRLCRCPRCGRWVKTLYRPRGAEVWWCRHCWGLKYPSQYTPRRPECDPRRIEQLGASVLRSLRRSPQRGACRLARATVALGQYQANLERHYRGLCAEIGHVTAVWDKHDRRKRAQP